MSTSKGSGNNNMPMLRACQGHAPARKLSKAEAARKLVRLVESFMDRKGLSEAKKNERVQRFADHVDAVSARRAK